MILNKQDNYFPRKDNFGERERSEENLYIYLSIYSLESLNYYDLSSFLNTSPSLIPSQAIIIILRKTPANLALTVLDTAQAQIGPNFCYRVPND